MWWAVGWCCHLLVLLLPLFSLAASKKPLRSGPASLPSGAAVPTTQPVAVPDVIAQARALRLIREAFGAEYAARTPAERQALAARLLEQSLATHDDPAGRFVALCEARDIAAAAGDPATALAAVGHLGRFYPVDELPMTVGTLSVSLRHAKTPPAYAQVARLTLLALERAILADDYSAGTRLASLAQSAAEKAAHVTLLEEAQTRARELQAIFLDFERVAPARQTLTLDPDNPAANERVGRFLCFVKSDWAAGLPHLARSADAALSALARSELSAPNAPAQRIEIANGWWELSSRQGGLARKNLAAHAAALYRQVLPDLTGLHRALAEKRLQAHQLQLIQERHLAPGLFTLLFKGVDAPQLLKSRIDPQIDFDWKEDPPDPELPKDHFSLRFTGLLQPPVPGHYQLTVLANSGVRLWIDEKLLLDAPDLTRIRNGAHVPIALNAEFHSLRLEYWDTTGQAKLRLLWQLPGAPKAQPIPASAFYHDPAAVGRPALPER